MSLFCLVLLIVLLSAGTALAVAQKLGDFTTIPGDNDHPHNFSSNSGAAIHDASGVEDRICVFCHTPHSASSDGPLWNRNDPRGPNGDGTFPLYGQLDDLEIDTIAEAEYDGTNYPNGATRLCLSCHDGVTAIGEVINPGSGSSPLGGLGSIQDENPASSSVIDLSTSHPVSFVYNDTVRTQLNSATEFTLPTGSILDSQQRMQCTSCHDPHSDTFADDGTYDLPMWRNYTGTEAVDYENTCGACHVGGSGSSGLVNKPAIGGNHNL